jgi:hypothetical protein
MYKDLSTAHQKDIAIILAKISHHIHPEIVKLIQDENTEFKAKFAKIKHPNCNSEAFLYEGSDCVFPGFRRPINREKNPRWKNKVYEADGTILNDNTFPRHIWSFLTANRPYSGGKNGTWASSDLDKFELAHIFAHKTDERKSEEKMFLSGGKKIEPYGLFTSASNVVLIPKGFAKPTDHLANVKACFYKRHFDLYKDIPNTLNGLILDESEVPDWYKKKVKWPDPILPDDWEKRIKKLLKYRQDYLIKKYAGKER